MNDPAEFTRAIEAYLTRKNDGHLIRIVGPAFEQVCSWAERGIPLNVAYRGVDRYFERYYAKGPRRRPVRVEFCEPDVLDVFDEWRRAVGVSTWSKASALLDDSDAVSDEPRTLQRVSLPSHLERVVARLTALRSAEDRSLGETLDAIVRELDAARTGAKALRGAARDAFLERLRGLDRVLIDAVRERADAPGLRQLEIEAEAELAPFRERMPKEAFEQSRTACVERLLRERAKLPIIAFE